MPREKVSKFLEPMNDIISGLNLYLPFPMPMDESGVKAMVLLKAIANVYIPQA